MRSLVQRTEADTARPNRQSMLYYVTLYDPKTWEAEEPVPVEAASKQEAAERICRVKLSADAKIEGATASVVRLGEASNRRQYFRRA